MQINPLLPSHTNQLTFNSFPTSHEGQVRHYHIKHDDGKYYISEKHRFSSSIRELIEYHKLNGGGLVTRLRKPPLQLLPQLNTLSPLFGGCGPGWCVCSLKMVWRECFMAPWCKTSVTPPRLLKLFEFVREKYARGPDILVNNAGLSTHTHTHTHTNLF